MSTTKTNDKIVKNEAEQKELTSSIMLALDLENAFKMYSYRIISTEVFNDRVSDLVEEYGQTKGK